MNDDSKKVLFFIGIALTLASIAVISMIGMRWLNASTVAVTIHNPQPGIVCAVATSADGVGISCWEAK